MTTTDQQGTPAPSSDAHLAHGLRPRHLTMMGLGSAIGAGLFLGSGQAIGTAGPAVLISYAIAGAIVVLVMRMLAEMASAMPASGSFSVYAEAALGRWAGFLLGWVYWFMLIMVLGVEVTGVAEIVTGWWPSVPQWAVAAVIVAVLGGINLVGVRQFGEAEFWFALIKVVAILAFLVVGVLIVVGVIPVSGSVLGHWAEHGGFAPAGVAGIAAGLLAVAFAFGGIEIVAIAAAEARDPRDAVARATRTILWRILFFYVGAVAIIVALVPWDDAEALASPFVSVLQLAGFDWAARLMEVVVALALLSAFNANVYGTSRMLFSLGQRDDAPKAVTKVSRRDVPWVAVLVSVFFGVVAVVLNWLLPEALLSILLNAVGSALFVVWLLITISQLRLRPRLEAEAARSGEPMRLRMWGFPWLSWVVLVALVGLAGLMLSDAAARAQLTATAGLVVVILAVYALTRGVRRARD
ncbi:amino acid permease [Isoptericola cucumis]|uniref:Aromatic amino acid transport protein AroP n=1 Tax=Isoptericola cucumis TaxID=1776856 RepID=A0ABQ2BAL7_9MICO|nr:amino acid permease [Isoptericola cucumis]GGI11786.1 aromatic amino acid transport protein AroP [Isoptericola cucumis]